MLVYDGTNACMREWDIDGTPPPGFVKKIQHIEGYKMDRLFNNSRKLREIEKVIESYNKLPGIRAMFHQIGCGSKDIVTLAREMEWHDLPGLSAGCTHGLLLIADGLKEYKGWMHSKAHKKEWAKATEGLIDYSIAMDNQLGMDLVKPTSQKDPMTVICLLRLNTEMMHEGSELMGIVNHIIGEFNEMPGIKACIQPAGFAGFSWQEWLDEVWMKDDSFGVTFVFTMVANNPLCFKRWRHSEQFGGFSEVLGHSFMHEHGLSPMLFMPLPMELSTTC